MKNKIKKLYKYIKTHFYYILVALGVMLAYIPISYSNNVEIVRNFSSIAFLLLVLFILLLINSFQTVLYQYRKYLNEKIKNDESLKELKDKFDSIVGENL